MVLRGLYGLRPEIWVERLRCCVGRTSTGLICWPLQNINHTISIKYDLQPYQNEGHRGSSHPRLSSSVKKHSTILSPVNRGTKEPPPQRTKRARRKSSGGAAVDWRRCERHCFEHRNLRHSERRERGGKVPEGLRLTGERDIGDFS